jgi:hypothetical protein
LSAAVDTGKVQIVGGVYDLHSGRISPLRSSS